VFLLIENDDEVRVQCVAVQVSVSPVQVHLHQLITNRQRLYTVSTNSQNRTYKSSTVAEMGDRFATVDVGRG